MMSSGTTEVATLNLIRKFIGIEKDYETFEIARLQINDKIIKHLSDLKMDQSH